MCSLLLQFDKLETQLEHESKKYDKVNCDISTSLSLLFGVQLKRRFDIKKKALNQKEVTLKDKKEKLQQLHEETAYDPDLMGGRMSVGSFEAASFRGATVYRYLSTG